MTEYTIDTHRKAYKACAKILGLPIDGNYIVIIKQVVVEPDDYFDGDEADKMDADTWRGWV